MAREPSAAEALYSHLPSRVAERPVQRPTTNSVAAAMFPGLRSVPSWSAWAPPLDREAVRMRMLAIQAKWDAEKRKR
jgi:hypothetical protein